MSFIQEYRGYQIKPDSKFPSNYIVVTAGRGGKIPAVLDSLFTTPSIAKETIDIYLLGKDNGKASTES